VGATVIVKWSLDSARSSPSGTTRRCLVVEPTF